MGIRIIYGPSGTGKSSICINEIKENVKQGQKNALILVVPEQYSYEAEKCLAKAVNGSSPLTAEVLSFKRMAYRTLSTVKSFEKEYLSKASKSIIISRIIEEKKDDFYLFAGMAGKTGFIKTLSDIIAELKRYDISTERLKNVIGRIDKDDSLYRKLSDIYIVYKEYEKRISAKFTDPDNLLDLLCKALDDSSCFTGSKIWIDGFSGFTPQEYNLIKKLLLKGCDITICLTTDYIEDEKHIYEADVFAPVKKTCRKLILICRENNIDFKSYKAFDKRPWARYENSPALSYLEGSLFSYNTGIYNGKTDEIEFFCAKNIYREVEGAALRISELVSKEGYRYKDIAVSLSSFEEYESIIDAVFQRYDIPFFIDRKKDIISNPVSLFILSALEVTAEGWTYQSIFKYLKTMLAGINHDDIDILENYVLRWGIKGKAWINEDYWPYPCKDEDAGMLEKINEVRNLIREPLIFLENNINNEETAGGKCRALYEFMIMQNIPEKIEGIIETFSSEGKQELVLEYSQVWDFIIELLKSLNSCIKDDRIDNREFLRIVKAGLSEYKIGVIPPTLDQIMIADTARSRTHKIKALFVLGANDQVFPKAVLSEGILSDFDRITLDKLGVETARNTAVMAMEQQYQVYKCLTAPSGMLRISWAAADGEGNLKRPSMYVGILKKIFPNAVYYEDRINKKINEYKEEIIFGKEPSLNYFIGALKEGLEGERINDVFAALYGEIRNNKKLSGRLDFIMEGFNKKNKCTLSKEYLKELYGDPVIASVSRIESYISCPFAFFLQYGIKADERNIFKFDAPDFGVVSHEVMERVSKTLEMEGISWHDADSGLIKEAVDIAFDGITKQMPYDIFKSGCSMEFIKGRMKRMLEECMNAAVWQVKRGIFNPKGYEVSLPVTTEKGHKFKLTGRIDRMDICEIDGKEYVRIIDYKTSKRELSLESIYYGIELQLPVYMGAVLKSYPELKPAGILYFELYEPLITAIPKADEKDIDSSILKEFKMRGYIIKNEKIIKAMDKSIMDEYRGISPVIPVAVKKDGNLSLNSKTLENDDFNAIINYSMNKLKEEAGNIKDGDISISPYKLKGEMPCEYCRYKEACGYDSYLTKTYAREFKKLDKDRSLELIKKAWQDTGGNGG